MRPSEIAYLGPKGTFSNQVAELRFGPDAAYAPQPSIHDVCRFAAAHPARRGIVPVENSSGGPISETVDILVSNKFGLRVEQAFQLNVKLALLGRAGVPVRTVYSHATPMCHCEDWLRRELPDAAKSIAGSTAMAAELAAKEPGTAAIASKNAAAVYGLDVLVYPIEQDVPNMTQFYCLCLEPDRDVAPPCEPMRTSVSARLADRPGSLYDFLEPFKNNRRNLTRILSRPVYGRPSEYAFFIDVDGDIQQDAALAKTVHDCTWACSELHILGAYPARDAFEV